MGSEAEVGQVATLCTLEETIKTACTKLGTGAERSGAECLIPLDIWKTNHFQQWYSSQISAGHILEDVPNIEWVFRVGSDKAFPLLMAIHVAIKVSGEGRVKSNEVVIIRPSIVTVCAYCPAETREQDRFILVREYRTPVINARGFVFELPGGSTFKADVDPTSLAMEELAQETGMRLSPDRFQFVGQRQLVATLVASAITSCRTRLPLKWMRSLPKLGKLMVISLRRNRLVCMYSPGNKSWREVSSIL